LLGGAVASTIGKGLVDTNVVMMSTVLCALIAAITWNLLTWWVSGVKWTVVERIIWAWVLTVPAKALLGYILSRAAAHGLAGEGDFSSRLNRHPTVARS
jgi:phosphate/sulfate permease